MPGFCRACTTRVRSKGVDGRDMHGSCPVQEFHIGKTSGPMSRMSPEAEMGQESREAVSTSPRWGEVGPRRPKSDVSDLGNHDWPNSGTPEFGRRGPGEGVTIFQRKLSIVSPSPYPSPQRGEGTCAPGCP